ncbi:uncharacterized protein LOC121388927 [Gigantopelta aegis]|uniref:uncharacterized protein LOC121388927 n=1 Tax=Gigantopelta aegis TaxID=1735272 RepID=UPI001B888577|nr:uncharacterized protein LOC121388927 [Gigantopelta aegis]
MSCTSWGDYNVHNFRFDSHEEEVLQDTLQSSDVIEISCVSHHTVLHGRTRLPLNDFEEALWQDFAVEVPILPGVTCPVLNLCFSFQDHENYPEDPIIDGLPATVWMERFEPTLRTHIRHGDFGFGPPAGNRRDNARVDQLQPIEEDEDSITDLTPYCNARPRNRHRRIAENQSANPDLQIQPSISQTPERPTQTRQPRNLRR